MTGAASTGEDALGALQRGDGASCVKKSDGDEVDPLGQVWAMHVIYGLEAKQE